MNKFTKEQITEFFKTFWRELDAHYYDPEIEISIDQNNLVKVYINNEYEKVPFSSKMILGIGKYFNIEDFETDEHDQSGCETCDHGSSYGYTFRLPIILQDN